MKKMSLEEYKGVYVFAQQVDGEVSGIAYELLGKAKDLAKDLNAEVTAVLLGYGGINSRSNPCVLRSGATYLEACFRTSFSDSHTLFALPGHCRGNYLFGCMVVEVAPLLRGW